MPWQRKEIAAVVAGDIEDGWTINIGVGLPTLVPALVPASRDVWFHSENGVLGMTGLEPGEEADPDLVDAGKRPVAVRPGGSLFDSSLSFAMIRGGHIDLGLVGALQVARNGDIANWRTDARMIGGIGGAADVCAGVRRLWVAMSHLTDDGQRRLLERCTYPLTSTAVVARVYTDLAVLRRVGDDKWVVGQLAPNVSVDQVAEATGFPLEEEGNP